MVQDSLNFLVSETGATNGNTYRIQNRASSTIIVISISGTATSYSAVLEAKGIIGDYVTIYGWDETNKTLISTATESTGKLITVDATGKDYFRIRLSAVSGGDISASGKVVE